MSDINNTKRAFLIAKELLTSGQIDTFKNLICKGCKFNTDDYDCSFCNDGDLFNPIGKLPIGLDTCRKESKGNPIRIDNPMRENSKVN